MAESAEKREPIRINTFGKVGRARRASSGDCQAIFEIRHDDLLEQLGELADGSFHVDSSSEMVFAEALIELLNRTRKMKMNY